MPVFVRLTVVIIIIDSVLCCCIRIIQKKNCSLSISPEFRFKNLYIVIHKMDSTKFYLFYSIASEQRHNHHHFCILLKETKTVNKLSCAYFAKFSDVFQLYLAQKQ